MCLNLYLEERERSIPKIVKAEPDSCLLQRLSILEPDQLHFEERPRVRDALQLGQPGALDDDRVLRREEDLGGDVGSVFAGNFQKHEIRIFVLAELSIGGSGPEKRLKKVFFLTM